MTTEQVGGLASSISDFGIDGLDGSASLGTMAARKRTLNPSAMRELIPASGLREYWYPAIVERKVGHRRPTKIELLGDKVVLFRDKKGEVVASSNVCPHRGGSIGDGHCHYAGTISCPYHGWTFDENGDCVAVLGEGPESPIPGNEGARLRMYPTATLKGLVFIWMGEADPVPLEEDIPPEFFLDNSQIQYSVSNWTCNWRQAIENGNDAHTFYVHKTSLQFLRLPANRMINNKLGPTRPRAAIINGRAVAFPRSGYRPDRPLEEPLQDSFAGLDGRSWPKHAFVRMLWAKLMTKTVPLRLKTSIDPAWTVEEWRAFHLPGLFRTFSAPSSPVGGNYLYSRYAVPLGPKSTRMFYFYTTYGRTRTERVINKIWYTVASNWFKNYNFSGQDQAVMEPQVYDVPEALSATDIFPLAIRRLAVERGRDFLEQKPAD